MFLDFCVFYHRLYKYIILYYNAVDILEFNQTYSTDFQNH